MDWSLFDAVAEEMCRRFGWKLPNDRTSFHRRWFHIDGVGVCHEVKVTRSGDGFLVGNKRCVSVEEAILAVDAAAKMAFEPVLLAMFGLRREWGIPDFPVVPLAKSFKESDYSEELRKRGIW